MLAKGDKVGITGELTNRPYTDKQGNEKHILELRVSDLTLLSAKGDTKPQAQQNNAPKAQSMDSMDDLESDLPFMNPYKFNWRMI